MPEMTKGTIIRSEDNAIFFKVKEAYKQMMMTTEFNIAVDTNVETKKFIAFRTETDMPKSIKLSLENDLYTIKGEPDFEYFFDLYYNLPKGMPAPQDILIVYKCLGSKESGFKGWHFPNAQIMFSGYDTVKSTLNFTFNFGEGELGTITMIDSNPTFNKAEE